MIFSKGLDIRDVALGLTALAAIPVTGKEEISNIREYLAKQSHEEIFAYAREVAEEYGHELLVFEMSRDEFFADWNVGFAVAQVEGKDICGICAEDGKFLMPPQYQDILVRPERFTVIRSRRIVKQFTVVCNAENQKH